VLLGVDYRRKGAEGRLSLAVKPPWPLDSATAEAVPVEASIIATIIAIATRTVSFFLTSSVLLP
jgi:hypothetical protein